MCVCGSSEPGKSFLIYKMFREPVATSGIFQPPFYQVFVFYRFWQSVYDQMAAECSPHFIFHCISSLITEGVERSSNGIDDWLNKFVENFEPVTGQSTLLLFDDSCEEVLESKAFENLATAGRHKKLHVIFIKHNLYQKGKYSVTIDKNTTHIILTQSPRIGRQLKILGTEIECAPSNFIHCCYQLSMSKQQYGHFLVDLTTQCPDELRFCTNITSQCIGSLSTGQLNISIKNNKVVNGSQLSCTTFFRPAVKSGRLSVDCIDSPELNEKHSILFSDFLKRLQNGY